jgi:predicted metal-dependent hydrolase
MDRIPVDQIIRSRRRTIALIVTPEAKLVVRSPMRTPVREIEDLVRERNGWIRKKMEEMKRRPAPRTITYSDGELFLFLGRPYPLTLVRPGMDGITGIVLKDRLYVPDGPPPDIKKRLLLWYRDQAKEKITARCAWFAMITGNKPVSVRITDAKQRWGSCSTNGTVNFSWRLVLAPLEIIDYIIVHELIHLEQPDHSKVFWNKVKSILPDYERRRAWLNENERLLAL